MSDVGFTLPDKRWDPPYAVTDFIPQSEDVFERLAKDCDGISEEADLAARVLTGISVPQWKGAAKVVFMEYVDQLATYTRTLGSVADETCAKVKTCGRSITSALGDAQGAVTALNKAQQDRRDLTKDDKGGLGGLLDKLEDVPKKLSTEADLDTAYKHALQAGDEALTAMSRLAAALDPVDATVSALRAPEPPSSFWSVVFDHVPPDQLPLLQALFGPVGDALAGEGVTANAQAALDRAQAALGGSPEDKKKYLTSLTSLSPKELAYVLDHMDEDDVAALLGSLDPKKDRAVYNKLAMAAPAELLTRLGDTDPNHYWHPYTGQGGKLGWEVPTGMLPGQVPTGDPSTLQQGGLGDCHVLSALAAAEKAHPGFLKDHVKANPNGTYTVTLYKDGKPMDVVVTAEFPFTLNPDGTRGSGAYSHSATNQDQTWTGNETLYMIYEKALAQTWGETDPNGDGRTGYDGMNGGNSAHDMPVITGTQMNDIGSSGISSDDIKKGLDGHKPVTVGTLSEGDASGNPLYAADGNNQLIPGHAYYVLSVTGTGPDAKVVLANPWGAQLPGTGTVTLTLSELQHGTTSVQIGK
jgi:Calpain family cysteine protease